MGSFPLEWELWRGGASSQVKERRLLIEEAEKWLQRGFLGPSDEGPRKGEIGGGEEEEERKTWELSK